MNECFHLAAEKAKTDIPIKQESIREIEQKLVYAKNELKQLQAFVAYSDYLKGKVDFSV